MDANWITVIQYLHRNNSNNCYLYYDKRIMSDLPSYGHLCKSIVCLNLRVHAFMQGTVKVSLSKMWHCAYVHACMHTVRACVEVYKLRMVEVFYDEWIKFLVRSYICVQMNMFAFTMCNLFRLLL